jgi:hypothetical protein
MKEEIKKTELLISNFLIHQPVLFNKPLSAGHRMTKRQRKPFKLGWRSQKIGISYLNMPGVSSGNLQKTQGIQVS